MDIDQRFDEIDPECLLYEHKSHVYEYLINNCGVVSDLAEIIWWYQCQVIVYVHRERKTLAKQLRSLSSSYIIESKYVLPADVYIFLGEVIMGVFRDADAPRGRPLIMIKQIQAMMKRYSHLFYVLATDQWVKRTCFSGNVLMISYKINKSTVIHQYIQNLIR